MHGKTSFVWHTDTGLLQVRRKVGKMVGGQGLGDGNALSGARLGGGACRTRGAS
jgi:hypothetical protein